jgi:sec-independent protein translocase protein TatC
MAVSTAPASPPPDYMGGRPMTILEHLLELRMRLIWCCIGLIVGVTISFIFVDPFMEFLRRPMEKQAPEADLIATKVLENFTIYFKVALLGGLILSMPILVYQMLMFVLPALTPEEKRWVLPVVAGIFLCFLAGVLFAYYVTLPPALRFLLNFNTDVATPLINIADYINFVTRMVFWIGVSFETPLIILALARFGMVTGRKLLSWWRYIIVLVFVVAAVVTPTPDPLTQSLVAGPLLVLYAIGVVLAFLFGRDRGRRVG